MTDTNPELREQIINILSECFEAEPAGYFDFEKATHELLAVFSQHEQEVKEEANRIGKAQGAAYAQSCFQEFGNEEQHEEVSGYINDLLNSHRVSPTQEKRQG